LDDGDEAQSSALEGLFRAMEGHPGVVSGTFIWGMMLADDDVWARTFGLLRGFDVRGRPAEAVVRWWYGRWGGDS
ncbi:MAG: hypothetical protein AB1505_25200, partial [Candidatus Latescibacterota bacterium]